MSDNNIECCVCFEPVVEETETTDCNHAVCQDCLGQLRSPTCPMCREPIELVGPAAERIAKKEFKKKQGYVFDQLMIRLLLRGNRRIRRVLHIRA